MKNKRNCIKFAIHKFWSIFLSLFRKPDFAFNQVNEDLANRLSYSEFSVVCEGFEPPPVSKGFTPILKGWMPIVATF